MKTISKLDTKDIAILCALQADGRIPLAQLGRQIGLSQPSVSERVKQLEETGVISGYSANINRKVLGLGMMAVMRVRTSHEHIKTCLSRFETIPNIIDVYRVTGEYCFVLHVIVPSPEDLEQIVDRIAGFGGVETSIVLSSETSKGLNQELLKLCVK